MELPPPPPHAGPPQGTPLSPPSGPWAEPARPYEMPVTEPDRPPSRLGGGWRWTLGLGWCVVLGGLGALAQAAFLVDADPWWLVVRPLPFALPVAVLLALVSDSRWALPLSGAAAAVLAVLAIVDAAGGNPVVAVAEAVCALSGILLTLAAVLGRDPVPPGAVRGSGP